MRLSDKERKILALVQHRAAEPLTALCRLTGYRAHTIRYAIQSLLERGLIYPFTPVSVAHFGLMQCALYFSDNLSDQKSRVRLQRYLIESQWVSVSLEFGGEFQYGITLCVSRIEQVVEFCDKLTAKFGEVFYGKCFAVRQAYFGFGRKYFSTAGVPRPFKLLPSGRAIVLDEITHRILRAVNDPECLSLPLLARKVGLPESTLRYRLKQLRAAGAVQPLTYGTKPGLMGMLEFRILLDTRAFSSQLHESIIKFAAEHRQIVYLVCTLGAWDYELGVEVPDHGTLKQVLDDLQNRFKNSIQRTTVIPILQVYKVNYYPYRDFSPQLS